MTPEDVAEAVAKALERRPNKDSYAPWRWAMMAPWARVFPGLVAWLFRTTGHKR